MTLRMFVSSMSINSPLLCCTVAVAVTVGFLAADTVGSVGVAGGLAADSLGGRSTDRLTGARFCDFM